ncbi:hypothetical protein [Membranihabitans maritimus]|uniref:hypothetical protein n=1 Tax=Membranihabitans maritimus TaxID=2904244 RepID=UPI001F1E326D|nr:hypothetical protein [Membranihabitans maritimus]
MEKVLGVGSRVRHPMYGKGVITALNQSTYDVCFIDSGIKPIGKNYDNWDVIEEIKAGASISMNTLEKSIEKVLIANDLLPAEVELANKWEGGMLEIKSPGDTVKSKEIPITTFFHKIVMVRDRIRVMEQRINASKGLTDEEKVNLQQYITRIYGSLTTFNVLFQDKEDYFKGEGK